MAVDLVDTIEIIGIALDKKQHNYGIPNAFGHTMVAIYQFSAIALENA